jgi:hypothetical protein
VTAGPLWTEKLLWVFTRARVGSWSAQVTDQAGTQLGYADVHVIGPTAGIRLLDAAGAPQLQMAIQRGGMTAFSGRGMSSTTLGVTDAGGMELGEIATVKFFNRRVTLALRVGGEELGRLAPVEKDVRFAVKDASGTQVARVERVQTGGGLLSEDMTWALMIERPLPQPLDALILGAGVALNQIQHSNLI